jgi:hypothetical protein
MQLYNKIKDDYINISKEPTDPARQIIYATHKMNVLLDICRDSKRIKNIKVTNPILFSRYMITLYSIYSDYIILLKKHDDYCLHKDKEINLYSGMITMPAINDCTMSIKLPINTTLRPNGYFVRSDDQSYLNFKTTLDGLVIPIIGSCYAKWAELKIDTYTTSEYEFLYIGMCDLPCENHGHIKTQYNFSYDIYLKMYYNNKKGNLELLLEKHGTLKTALQKIKEEYGRDPYETNIDIDIQTNLIRDYFNFIILNFELDFTYRNNPDYFKDLYIQVIYQFFIHNIINNYINSNEKFQDFIYNMRYICIVINNHFKKIKDKDKDEDKYNLIFIFNSLFILATLDTIDNVFTKKYMSDNIIINNEFKPEYIEIRDSPCNIINIFKQFLPVNKYKYLKYKY